MARPFTCGEAPTRVRGVLGSARERMDVTCERCGTEYEFEETLVSERGTTVKCTQCGHLFKVFRPKGEGARPWILLHPDGRRETLGSLGDLQKRITRGDLSESDQISRSGDQWKSLGEIAELEPFFRAARTASAAARRHSTRPPVAATIPRPSAPPVQRPSQAPRTAKSTLMGVGTSAPPPADATVRYPRTPSLDAPPSQPPVPRSQPAPSLDAPRSRPAPSATPRSQPAPSLDAPRSRPAPSAPPPSSVPPAPVDPDATAAPMRPPRPPKRKTPMAFDETIRAEAGDLDLSPPEPTPAPEPTPVPEQPPVPDRLRAPTLEEPVAPASPTARPGRRNVLYLDDDEIQPPTKRSGGRIALGVVLILLLAGGAAAALQWNSIGPALGFGGSPVAESTAGADAELAKDTPEGYAAAVAALEGAESPDHLAALGRAHVAWAQWLHFRASDLDARAVADPGLAADAAPLHEESRRHAQAAVDAARESLDGRRGPDAELVLADGLRLLGDDEAGDHLNRAAEGLPDPTPELRLAQALAQAEGDRLATALPHARRAAQMEGAPLRSFFLLARVALAADDVGEARAAIRQIRERAPGHPEADYLADAIDRGLPPAAPVLDVPDAGVADAGLAEPEEPEPTDEPAPRANASAGTASSGGTSSGAPPEGRDYSWYIRQGDALRRSSNFSAAREHYQQALTLRPNSPEATTGLGYVELLGGNASASLAHFRIGVRANYGDAYMGLGDAYRRLGQLAEARRVYERYLASQPGGVHATTARRLLEELPGGAPSTEPSPSAMSGTEAAVMEADPAEPAPTMEAETPPAPGPTPAPAPAEPAPSDTEAPE